MEKEGRRQGKRERERKKNMGRGTDVITSSAVYSYILVSVVVYCI